MTTSTDIVDISLSLSISIYTTYDFCDFHINMICKVRKFFFLQIFNFDVMQINDYISMSHMQGARVQLATPPEAEPDEAAAEPIPRRRV